MFREGKKQGIKGNREPRETKGMRVREIE